MNASQILQSDLLDIIFENRNKAYGAYPLRKCYDQQILKSLSFVIFMMAVFTSIVFNLKNPDAVLTQFVPDHHATTIVYEVPPVKPKDNRKTAKHAAPMSNKFIFVDSLQLDSILVDDNRLVSMGTGDVGEQPASFPVSGDGGSLDIAPPAPLAPVARFVDMTKPIERADIDPSYPGGLKALTKFLERNLENPQELHDGEIRSVKVKFVVGFDGELKAFEVKEDGGEAFNKEVIRVLKKMPRWIPGKTDGKSVSVYFTIPVKFINVQ